MKKVLVVAYDFPPLGGAASLRITKLVKYLPEFGWLPLVLTVRRGHAYHGFEDASLLEELPSDLRVFRTRCPEPDSIWSYFRKRGQAQTGMKMVSEQQAPGNLHGLGISLDRFLRMLLIPDPRVGWFPFGLKAGLNISQREKIHAVITTSPPATGHLIGLWLKKFTGKPWIADFRDSWTDNPFATHSAMRKFIEERMERKIAKGADHIIAVSEPIAQMLKSKHGLRNKKTTVIPNGFDRADFLDDSEKRQDPRPFTVTYLGTLGPGRSPNFFLAALSLLVSENPSLKKRLMVRFVGNLPKESKRLVEKLSLDDVVKDLGFLPHRQSLQLLAGSDILLLLLDDLPKGEAVYTAKLFEYLAAGRPILALAPHGVAADLVRESRTGIVVLPHEIKEIKSALEKMYDSINEGTFNYNPDQEIISSFDRRNLTGRVAELLNEVTSR